MENLNIHNNTRIIKATRENGDLIKVEIHHQCIGDVFHTLDKKDIEEGIGFICFLCKKDLVTFD